MASQEAVDKARRIAQDAGMDIDFSVGDWRNMPFEGAKFDFAFDMRCFGRIPIFEKEVYVDLIHRVIKDRGFFLLMFQS